MAGSLIGAFALSSAFAEQLRGKVLRWEPEFGALHLEQSTGEEVVVPVSDATEISGAFGRLSDGQLFDAGEWVTVSREGNEPTKIAIERPDQQADITPGEIGDEMETSPPTTPTPEPTPEPTAAPGVVAPAPTPVPTTPPGSPPSPAPTATPDPVATVTPEPTPTRTPDVPEN